MTLIEHLDMTLAIPREQARRLPPFTPWREASNIITPNTVSWVPRDHAETSPDWTQLIPCAVLLDPQGNCITFRRNASDTPELHRRTSIIIGGHSSTQDAQHTWDNLQVMRHTLRRELKEEVTQDLCPPQLPEALVYDQSTPNCTRHLAVLYYISVHGLVRAAAPEEFDDDPTHNGRPQPISDLAAVSDTLDPWTTIIVSHLTSATPSNHNPHPG